MTIYSAQLVKTICDRLASGESLRSICRDPAMPDKATVFRWLEVDEVFRDQYASARDAGLDAMSEELLEIADERVGSLDNGATDGGAVARNRLRVDARKWYLSKLAPKKYGDRLELDAHVNVDIASTILAARKRSGR